MSRAEETKPKQAGLDKPTHRSDLRRDGELQREAVQVLVRAHALEEVSK